jgi:predicted transcriptional regulator
MVDDRDTQGRFTQRHSDAEVLEAVRAHEPAATSEVADELGIVRQSADYRLRRLQEEDRVASKKIGASLVWFLTDEGAAGEDIAASASSPAREPPGDVDASPEGGGQGQPLQKAREPEPAGETSTRVTETGQAVPREVGDLDLPGSGDTLRRRSEAVGACYLYLREEGTAQKSDFVREVYEDGHEAGYQSSGGWWNAVGKEGLRALAEQREEVIAPGGEGEHTWTFAGEEER